MIRRILVSLTVLLVAATAHAYIIPDQTAGTYRFKAVPGDTYDEAGVPTTRPTVSIGIVDSAGTVHGCTDLVQAVTYDDSNPVLIDVTFDAPLDEGLRLNAKAYGQVGCVGDESSLSVEFGLIYFLGPVVPRLIE